MPNLYVTPTEIKAAMPDGIRAATTKYDGLLSRLGEAVSRYVDRRCRRLFHPRFGVRYYDGPKSEPSELWVDDLLEIDTIEISSDGGTTWTALASSDYFGTVGGDPNELMSWTTVVLAVNGDYSAWPMGQKAVKVTGWWGYADERDAAWEDSGVTLAGNYTAGGASLSVADVTVLDRWAIEAALQAGRLLRVEDEVFEVTSVTNATPGPDTVSVIGARNGSSAANHASGSAIKIWRPATPVKQAVIIQAVRQLERGFQGFGDARATPEIGQLFFFKALDPEAEALLRAGYIRGGVG